MIQTALVILGVYAAIYAVIMLAARSAGDDHPDRAPMPFDEYDYRAIDYYQGLPNVLPEDCKLQTLTGDGWKDGT